MTRFFGLPIDRYLSLFQGKGHFQRHAGPDQIDMSHTLQLSVERVTIPVLQRRKEERRAIVMTTAYDAVTARIADPVVSATYALGLMTTLPVSMAMMNHHLDVVARTRPRALLVADMPFLSFHLSPDDTIRNAGGVLQRGADAVKLEGGGKRVEMIRALVNCEIPVMGTSWSHATKRQRDGWLQGTSRNADDALRLLHDAHQLQQAGCFVLVLEGNPAELAARATESLSTTGSR
ncbi:3-methyl-2-oxobutanoate hydroxymethyltransferase [Bradyrhizobium sp. 143]|uniref:3-methyl-2-oxobutanoate hydroxymethyltransferase n=1 Tax=Bradyrhizobium sp. 143 TaxID=2782619 RepID=UPI001FF7EAA2|nr:3-methyl-2-oxobutanoate hydroxymethyltransferase [Bradyrhizobium sp. 143]